MSDSYSIRLSKSSILASWIDSGRYIFSMMVALFISWSSDQAWVIVIIPIVALAMAVNIFLPIVQWATTVVTVTSAEISVRSGVFFSSIVTKKWDDCQSWEVSSSFGQARFNLVSIKLGDFSDPSSNMEISGIQSRVADRLQQQIPSEAQREELRTEVAVRSPKGGDLSHKSISDEDLRISYAPLDTLIAVTCNYQFLTIISCLFAAGSSIAEKLDNVAVLGIFPQLSGSHITIIAVIASVAVTVIGYSLRYRNLSFVSNGVKISIQHGALSSRRKTMNINDVEGIRVTANMVERVMKRYSVSILSSDTSAGHMDSRMTLRSITKENLEEIERKIWQPHPSSLRSSEPSLWRLVANTFSAVIVAIGTFFISINPVSGNYLVPLGVTMSVTLLYIVIFRTRATRVHQENSYTTLTRSMVRYEVLNFSDDALVGHKILAAGNITNRIRLVYVFMGGRITWPLMDSKVDPAMTGPAHI